MISNGTIPNDGCSTDGPSSPQGAVPWVQLFSGTSHLFLTIWCPADVLLAVDTLEEHLAFDEAHFFFFSLSWRNTGHAQTLKMFLKHKAKLYFMQSIALQIKGFKIIAFQDFPVVGMAAFGSCIFLTG